MTCQQCGTEIADKALVCFRCGAPTAGPAPGASPAPRRARSGRLGLILLAALLLVVEYMLVQARGVRVPAAVLITILVLSGLLVVRAIWPRR